MTYRPSNSSPTPPHPRISSAANGRGAPPYSTSTSPAWTTVGTKAAPTPGRRGRDRAALLQGQLPASSRLLPRQASLDRSGHCTATFTSYGRWLDPPPPDTLTEAEQLRLKAVLVHCPELDALTGHVRSFAEILTERQGQRLPEWLDAVRNDNLPGPHILAAGIDRDRDAVIAGLTLPWNSGVVEGHVNRIKMLKRQMFGRAGFQLLRKRVLLYR
ncbi:transposase [Kitasatospora sp. NPDC002965]|uniref:transposase n=1 Tax=Kitasatospora sp. NPDC002965 TaxID=3154775 RepID=UPI0033ACD075